ncbi:MULTISPECIES: oligosaccharide flippase family protein [unclassified Clostridium]|uniref:lipopolysaccharide biosynthesis protein n=1 Tax=unclassified Clostridium TaxID=2614128 RepID=UPI00148690B8|nr:MULTISPECIES: oligosaccharide flippase family protein [unclassified Clostridium]
MMSENTTKQIRFGAVLSYGQMIMSIIVGIVYTPIMIRKFGQSEYGLYNTAASVISMLSILSLGFGSGYLKFYAQYKTVDKKQSIYRLNGLFMIVFSIIGIVALIIGLFLTTHLEMVYNDGLTDKEYRIAKILMLLLTLNLSISFPMSVFNTILSANERFIFQKIIGMGKTIVAPLLIIPLLFAGYKSIVVVSINVLLAIIVDVLNIFYVIHILHERFIFFGFEKGLFKSMFVYTSFILINTIVGQINWNIDKILLGRFQGTASVAIYSVASSLHIYYENFSTSVSNVFRTRVHVIVNSFNNDSLEQRNQLTTLMIKVGRIQFVILGLVFTGFIFFGKQFIVRYWAGADYAESYSIAILLMLCSSIVLIQNVGIDIQRALDKHKFRSIAYLFMSAINLVVTIILCKIWGALGAAIGTAMSVIIVDGLIMNYYYFKQCNIDIVLFWKDISRESLGLILPILFGIFCVYINQINSMIIYLSTIILYIIIYLVSIYAISLNREEKNYVNRILSKLYRRIV